MQPGTYAIKIASADKTATTNVTVLEDPRIQIVEADRGKLNAAINKVFALQKSGENARRSLQSLKTQITALQTTLKDNPDVKKETNDAVQKLSDNLNAIQKKLVTPPDNSGDAGPLFLMNRARCWANQRRRRRPRQLHGRAN